MFKRIISVLLIAALVVGVTVGCGDKDNEDSNNQEGKLGELEFDKVDSSTIENEELKAWIKENHKKEGVHKSDTFGESAYIILSGGQRGTGGYSVETTSVVGKENKIVVSGVLDSPNEGDMVTQALTYPYDLVRIDKDSRGVELGEFRNNGNEDESNVGEKGSGIYLGQIDETSIEIEVDGQPIAYSLAEDIRVYFDIDNTAYKGIHENDEVKFVYNEDGQTGQLTITDIKNLDGEGSIEDVTIGVYIARVDNYEIEVEVSGKTNTYRLTDDVKALIDDSTIMEGDTVSLFYELNSSGQPVITEFQKEPGFYLSK